MAETGKYKNLENEDPVRPPTQAPPGYVYYNPQPNSQQQLVVKTTIVHQTQQAAPTDYMVFAIMVTLFCCLPFGIVGIIKASKAKNRFASGDYEGAGESSKSAKNWSMAGLVTCLSIIVSVVITLVVIIVVVAAQIRSLHESYSNHNEYNPVPVNSSGYINNDTYYY